MQTLYIQSPKLSPNLVAYRRTLIDRLGREPGVRVTEMTLSAFADWYPNEAKKEIVPEFDLTVVECSLDTLARELTSYLGKDESFLRDRKSWSSIINESAMGAVLYASSSHREVVFVHYEGEMSETVINRVSFYPNASIMSYSELSNPDPIKSMVFSVDSGHSPFPIKTSWLLVKPGTSFEGAGIPDSAISLLAENFAGDDPGKIRQLHWWVLNTCKDQFGGRYDVVRTLCLTVKYAQHTVGKQLEGRPLLFQASIVPSSWWNDAGRNLPVILDQSKEDFKVTISQQVTLDCLLDFSNGHSTIFVFAEDGTLRALLDVGNEEGRTRSRLDNLRHRIEGFIVSTDTEGQIWLHSRDEPFPIIYSNQRWELESNSSNPVIALATRLAGKWQPPQIDRICSVIDRLSDERTGGFLIFHRDPTGAAAALNATPLRAVQGLALPLKVDSVSKPTLVHILRLDGAHFFDLAGRLCLVCQYLSITTQERRTDSAGTRHSTALRVAQHLPEAIVVPVSHDGGVMTLANGWNYSSQRSPTHL
jgi:hypothetical protein